MKKITFFIFQLIFIFSINSFIYIDLMLELIEKTASNSHYFNKVTLSDLYMNTIIIFIINFIPSIILSHIFFRINNNNNRLWIIPMFIIYTISWFYASYGVVSGYVKFFGHTWLKMEILIFTLNQNHIFIAYIVSLIFILCYLKCCLSTYPKNFRVR